MDSPRIVCAAIKNPESGIIIVGPRHYDPIMREQINLRGGRAAWFGAEQGFIDQFGTFYNRTEAFNVAFKEKQIIKRCGGDEGRLFSENLY